MSTSGPHHWLSQYATNHHAWTSSTQPSNRKTYTRPLGLVETSFDADGTYYGGRADMTATLKLAVRHTLSASDLRRRVVLAWTALRLNHVLLMARVKDDESGKRCFVVDGPGGVEEAVSEVERGMVWLDDLGYGDADWEEVHVHALNTGRVIVPGECLSKILVLPLEEVGDGTFEMRFLIVMAHQVSDGLSAYNWFSHFIQLLNMPEDSIMREIEKSVRGEEIWSRLPKAQEDLYPRIQGNRARQRWFWAIIRVLRHVQKTMPPTFTNPLRRETRLERAIAFEPKFDKLFDYSEAARPPMSSGHISASLSPLASSRLIALCRSINVSIGAGFFALAGLSMMLIHEKRYKDTPDAQRPAFAASFPLNPRAFFGIKAEADSCMLAFSPGILMPFLPSSLPVEGRFRLVAKHANRELRVYQKRLKDGASAMSVLDKHSSGRLLATGYVGIIERLEAKLPEERRTGANPQGTLKPREGQYGPTCGVSSVGSTAAFFRPGQHDLNDMHGKDFVADYRGLKMGVRARDNEFLVGSSTDSNGIVGFGVSYDMNAISQEAAESWAKQISELLEKGDGSRL